MIPMTYSIKKRTEIKVKTSLIFFVTLLLILSTNLHLLHANEINPTSEEIVERLKEIDVLLASYEREPAYNELLKLSEELTFESQPSLYLDVLSKLVLLEEFYWIQDSLTFHAIELYQLSSDKKYDFYRIIALTVLADLDYYNYENSSSQEKLTEILSLLSRNDDNGLLSDYYLGTSLLLIDEQDFDASRKNLNKALRILDTADMYSAIHIDKSLELYSIISDTYDYEEDYVSAEVHMEIILERIDENDIEQLILYGLRQVNYYLRNSELEKAKSLHTSIMTLYPNTSFLFQKLIPQNSIDRISAEVAYYEEDYQSAATLYQKITNTEYDYETIDSANAAQEAFKEFKNTTISEQISVYEELKKAQAKVIQFYQLGLLFSTIFMIFMFLVLKLLLKQKKLLYKLSTTDVLTNLPNRRSIMATLDSQKVGSCCIALIDLDHFKKINDNYGHTVGDQVLREIALTIKSSLRSMDHVGRYGGEEFLVIIETDSIENAIFVTERIRTNIEAIVWPYKGIKTTASIGLVYSGNQRGDALIREADRQLYLSKHNGRNQLYYDTIA